MIARREGLAGARRSAGELDGDDYEEDGGGGERKPDPPGARTHGLPP